MLEKDVLDRDLENAFAEMASTLDLEAPDEVAPWGFMAVAAFTPGPEAQASSQDAMRLDAGDITAIWKVINEYHNLAAGMEIKSVADSQPAILKLTKGIQALTTDPFYCVLPNDTYPITHAGVQQEVERVLQQFFDADLFKPKSKVTITPRDSPWLVGPVIAAVTYRAEAMDDPALGLQTKSFAMLFKQYGNWKINIISSDVFRASTGEAK